MDTRKYFFEICRQFGHAPSTGFINNCTGSYEPKSNSFKAKLKWYGMI